MNICLLNLDYKPYRTAGLTVYGELLAEGLHAAGHRVTVIASRRQESPLEEVIDGIHVLRVPIGPADWLGFSYHAAPLLSKLERTEPFDIVHFLDVHFAWRYRGDCIASAFQSFRQRLRAKGNKPYSHNLANYLFRYTYFVLVDWTIQRWAVTLPKVIIAASQSTKDEFVRHYSVQPERITLVPLGIDTEHYRPRDGRALRKELGLEGKQVILYVGFSTPRKGVEYLAQALDRLGPDCRLLLVGKWEAGYRAKFYRSLPAGVRDRVVEAGYVSDEMLPLYYSMADVFVFPSLLEGFGLPVVEAMACGTPVVAASASSLPEVVGDAGLLVPAMDAQALAEAIGQLLADEDLRRRLGTRGVDRARRFYSKENMVSGTLEAYQTYIERR